MKQDTLFLFTKKFPYSTAEQYLVDELPVLTKAFNRVIIVPCELFNTDSERMREVNRNVEVLLLNVIGAERPARKRLLEFLSVFFGEWMRSRSKSWFWKERKRYSSVLFHQAHLADVLESVIKQKHSGERLYFYAYWIHNSSVMLALLKRRGVIPRFVVRGHSIDLYEWDWALTRYIKILPFYNFIVRNADRVYAISEHGKKYLDRRFSGLSGKFKCSRLGVTDGGLNPWHPGSIFTIVSCSNFSTNKRVEFIAEIVSSLKNPVRWIHFGDGAGKEKVERMLENFPAHIQVELRGFVPNESIRRYYSNETVNLVINMSEAEGIPVALMEAISYGIPVIASAVYGNPEVANAQSGFSVPFESDAKSIAELIDKFVTNTELQTEKRKGARALYENSFSATSNYEAFIRNLKTDV